MPHERARAMCPSAVPMAPESALDAPGVWPPARSARDAALRARRKGRAGARLSRRAACAVARAAPRYALRTLRASAYARAAPRRPPRAPLAPRVRWLRRSHAAAALAVALAAPR
jgi:hypothetical protein